jgi:subfamily B ATP-binding cassette protein MsbA
MYLCASLKDLKEIIKYTFVYKGIAMLVVVCNLLFVVFNLLSLVLFIPVLQLIFRDPKEIALPAYPKSPDSLVGMGSYIKDFYQFHMATMVKHDPKMALIIVCLIVFAAFFLKNLFRYGAVWFQSELRMVVVRDVRNKIFYKSLILPLSFHSNERRGDIMARMNSDVGEIEIAVVSMLELIFREPIAVIINVVTLILLSPELTLFSLFLLPVSAFVISRINKSLKRTAKQGQEQTGLLYSSIDEALNGIRIIKAFSAINFIKNRFEHVNLLHQRLITKTFRKKDLAPLINETLGALIMLLLVYFGGSLILNHQSGGLSGEVFLTFIIVFSQMLRPIQGISSALANLAKARVSLDRINEILVQDEVIKNSPDAITLSSFTDSIGFENVSFSYKADLVLKNVSFTIKKGQTIAIVGESGSGKSTLLDLIPRFHDPSFGNISIDGVDLRTIEINDLRQLIGIVAQDSLLFNATILENIAFGDENPDMDRAINAAKNANAYDFIAALDGGFAYNVGDRGNKLSGGQKQRISIARAMYKNPEILLLDEATSALDTESERQVQLALDAIMKGKTSIVVAHRLSTIINADIIIVFKKGEIVESGSHHDLMSKKGEYARFCQLQGIGLENI